jgi:tetratricopeptide (TPR) repeat protein
MVIRISICRLFVLFPVVTAALFTSAAPARAQAPDRSDQDLRHRVEQLESQNNAHVAALQASIDSLRTLNEAHRSFMTNFGGAFVGLISVLIAIQGLSAWTQARRDKDARQEEKRRYDQHAEREVIRDRIFAEVGDMLVAGQRTRLAWEGADRERVLAGDELQKRNEQAGTDQVRAIFSVVRDTLDTRLVAEKEALDRARKAERKYANMQSKFSALEQFVDRFQTTIATARKAIEVAGKDLSAYGRHDFRGRVRLLGTFADKYDHFQSDYEPLEVPPREFSARAQYVRGIAAHYANQPDKAKALLEAVSSKIQTEPDESSGIAKKRTAIAQYFVGINYSNFADYDSAFAWLSQSFQDDKAFKDFLPRIALAEAKAQAGAHAEAEALLKQVIERLDEKERSEKSLPDAERKLRNRAQLMRVNLLIQTRPEGWPRDGLNILKIVDASDPHYYFAIATEAQLSHHLGNIEAAKLGFNRAYDEIRNSGDLVTVVEVRSRILLLLFAGICCLYAQADESRAKEHLDEALARLEELPVLDGKLCRVFSPLTKLNETKETIERHIKLIRNGYVLWREEDSSSAARA